MRTALAGLADGVRTGRDALVICPTVDPWVVPVLTGDFTRCDVAQVANLAMNVGLLVAGFVVFSLGVLVYRGRS